MNKSQSDNPNSLEDPNSQNTNQNQMTRSEINTLHDLTLENFLASDMSKLTAKVVGMEKKVFGARVNYIFNYLQES